MCQIKQKEYIIQLALLRNTASRTPESLIKNLLSVVLALLVFPEVTSHKAWESKPLLATVAVNAAAAAGRILRPMMEDAMGLSWFEIFWDVNEGKGNK